ncbi:MAG: FAD-dependent oxidoreductase, partial [Candidatus Zipacnadales bacterium]
MTALFLWMTVVGSSTAADSPVGSPPVTYVTDVLVVGGGPSGCAAAIGAARNGAGVLLVEQYGYLGGMGTAGGVNVFMSYSQIGGIFREMMKRLAEYGGRDGPRFNPETLKLVLDEMVLESGVKLLLHTKAIGVDTETTEAPHGSVMRKGWKRVTGVIIDNKSGTQIVKAKLYIDATGDGDLAYYAGAQYEMGRAADGLTQPMTMMFRLGGCTWQGGGISDNPALAGIHMSMYRLPNEGEVLVNMTRISGLSGVSGEDLTAAEIEGRKQVHEAVKLLRENVPGMEHAFLIATPTQIGVRETRRIVGATIITEQDLMTARHFSDVMARSSYPIDIHNPAGQGARIVRPPAPYEIPYRTMIPKGLTNLFVTGRCISSTHEAMSAIRVQPTCYALGEATGTAAALCIRHGVGPWDMAPYLRKLQVTLIKQGADLGEECAERLGLGNVYRANLARYQREERMPHAPFTDVPRESPLYEAVETVRVYGLASGVGQGRFGPKQIAPQHIVIALLGRAFEAVWGTVKPAERPELPAALRGQWWAPELQVRLAHRDIRMEELKDLQPDE